MIDPPFAGRRGLRIAGVAGAVLLTVALAGGGAALVAQRSGAPVALPGDEGRGVPVFPLRRAVDLRAGAAPDTAIVTQAPGGSSVVALGRSLDGAWLAVALAAATDVVGWVPADAVEGLRDASGLAVLTDASTLAAAAPSATSPPALPDLRIEGASAVDNRLVVDIANDGPGDLPTTLLVSVNDAPAVRLEAASGALPAGQRVQAVVPREYVQLRARLALRVQTEPADREANVDNNTWSGIVAPDKPNNLGIVTASAQGPSRHLVVTVRNDSPIPVRGNITLSVREALPSTTLLGRATQEIGLEAGATIDVAFPDVRQPDVAKIAIRLSTDAIHDAVLADDSFPRAAG